MAEDFMAMYKQALERLSTGGMSLEASLQEIEEGKKQAIAGGQQALVSGGMGGTTVMGGVPIQAEKIAARQRLGARGRAEEKYLTTLASFAAFAQRGEEAQKQRAFEAQQAGIQRTFGARQAELGRIEQRGPAPGTAASPFDVFGRYKEGRAPSIGGEPLIGGGQAQQFPSLYGQEGAAVPDWTGGTTDTPWPTAAPLFKEQEELGIGQPTAAAPAPEQPAGVPTSLAVGTQMKSMLPSGRTGSQYSQYKGRGGTASYDDWLKSGKPTGAPGKYYVGGGYATSPQEYA